MSRLITGVIVCIWILVLIIGSIFGIIFQGFTNALLWALEFIGFTALAILVLCLFVFAFATLVVLARMISQGVKHGRES